MFGTGSVSYEVQSRREGRWLIEGAYTDQESALSAARSQLAASGVEEAKVVKFRTIAGLSLETVILHKTAPQVARKGLTLGGTAEGAPLCRNPDDLRGFESRVVIGRLLRPYLDAQRITPTELLHSWPLFRRLEEQGALLGAAIHAVARHHADLHGVSHAARARELRQLVEAVSGAARDALAERRRLPRFDAADLPGTSNRIEESVGEAGHDALFLILLCQHLEGGGTLAGKLDLLLAMIDEDVWPRHLALLDGVVADIMGSADTMKELLGAQPNLHAGLCALADALFDRDPDPALAPMAAPLLQVCRLVLQGRAPQSRAVLLERLRQSIAGDQPLDRRDAKAEGVLTRDLADRLKGADGALLGGAAMEKALERRLVRHRQSVLRAQGMHDIADRLSGR
ncbi:hypothetical protein A6A40_07925 [Azospirillum humicireducens]|uniref:Uncharacterized protein n=1 Tax=Azospirillum humicireducens TaxID=1226968 RepID=A0A160JFY9_9PROT|nr:hypothetical protein [Azospirillum humicireducens]ANC91842.1 hypothetical protein A6A40_07925 [Azospirillum humicireducens]